MSADVMKSRLSRRDHPGFGKAEGDWSHRGESHVKTEAEIGAASQGTRSMPKIARNHEKPGGRHGTDSPSEPPKRTKVDANKYLWIE